ncbi:gluconokinase [Pseudomonadales bacterium]|nr:gluconokinase [Pseudomonadales bacterium]MDB9917887.1 gluconokinase [Pseudomonadales bacterium]MDC1307078.1 gluconokinase [Pseudomonadales bacterium]
MIVVVYGVSGSGKTTVGRLLAEQLNWLFLDADDFHPAANIDKLRSGTPLTDADRWPWLEVLAQKIIVLQAQGRSAVLACSALKPTYRTQLGVDESTVRSVWLRGSLEVIQARLGQRQHAFMATSLLQSQLATLQPSSDSLVVDIAELPEKICQQIIDDLGLG